MLHTQDLVSDSISLCELRFDIPLTAGREDETRGFERAWRAELAAQKRTALAMPPARAVTARFRVVGPETSPSFGRYLQARLAALPGGPTVTVHSEAARTTQATSLRPDWAGVQIWLAYPAADLPALLHAAKKNAKTNSKLNTKRSAHFRGHRL